MGCVLQCSPHEGVKSNISLAVVKILWSNSTLLSKEEFGIDLRLDGSTYFFILIFPQIYLNKRKLSKYRKLHKELLAINILITHD